MRVPIHYPGLQSPKFPCMNALCSGYKTKYNATKYQEQKARILAQLRDTDYKVTVEGNAYMKVGFMKKTRRTATEDKSKLNWWNLYTEDKLKEMTANGDSYEDIKTVRPHCFCSLHLYLSVPLTLISSGPPRYHWPALHHLPDHRQGCLIRSPRISVRTAPSQTRPEEPEEAHLSSS